MRLRWFIALIVASTTVTFAPAASAATPASLFTRWTSTTDLQAGGRQAVTVRDGAATLGSGTKRWSYDDPYGSGGAKPYDYGTWTSPWASTGFSATTLVPSWIIDTPRGTWARVDVRVRSGSTVGSWDFTGAWSFSTSGVHRASFTSQSDDLARVDVDTVRSTSDKTFSAYQLRVVLFRAAGTTAKPTLKSVGAIAANFSTRTVATSRTTMTATKELAVPRYSQMIHRGQYPQYGGGGEAWCSPTSTSMVLRYFGSGPGPSELTWTSYAEPWVDHAAMYTYDYRYRGTGNWPFNTAYAGRFGLDALVTRLANLRDVEAFIKAGIPVVTSIAFARGGLSGAPISSTPGHLLVVTGFQADGDVIANDPAGSSSSTVRRVYDRAQFEKAWMGGSGAIAYIIRPTSKPLPPDTARW
jgi:hypothetical protein